MTVSINQFFCRSVLSLLLVSSFGAQALSNDDAFAGRWWADNSFWNVPVEGGDAADYRIAPYSDAAIKAYMAIERPMNMNWDSAGVAVVYADSRSDPTAEITFKNYPDWLWSFPKMPMPKALMDALHFSDKAGNRDRMTCMYDAGKAGFYSFWKGLVVSKGQKISIVTGAFNPIDGAGGSSVNQFTPTGGRVAGANYCGGLIRPKEVESGRIDHALSMVWPNNLNRSYAASRAGNVASSVYPANHTDGTSIGLAGTIPMGARLQLDPSFNLDRLADYGLDKAGDRVIARALQDYGSFVTDSNTKNANAGFYFQSGYGRGKSLYDVTNPWPVEILRHMRFIETDFEAVDMAPLDTAASVGLPIRVK